MSNKGVKSGKNGKQITIEDDKDLMVSQKNEKLGQLRDFQLQLLIENSKLRLLQQFRKFLIQKQSQLFLPPLQAFNLTYYQPLDLIIEKDNQSLKIKFEKVHKDFWNSRKKVLQYAEKMRNVIIKKPKIISEIQEKQGYQIYRYRLKQLQQIDQHFNSLLDVRVYIKQFSEQQFELTIKIATRLLDNYQRTQEPSIKKISEEQILKPNNEAIQETNKRLLPIRIEQHSGVDNFNQIKHLKQSIKIKRQKFNHNYHSNEESQKITIEQFLEQFNKIEKELTQNEQEIENIISNIKKVKDSIVSEKNEKLGQLRDFKLPLLSENLRLLQQFRKFLIQKQSQLILLPQKAFNLNYDKNLDLLIYKDNQSQTKHKKQLDYYGKICRSLRLNEVIQDVLMKKQKIKEEILKEKQGCQIYHFRLKQFIQIGQHYYCICEFIQKIQELLKQIFKSLDNYQRTQEPSIKKISEEQILKPNNEAIQETNKRLLPIRIEQHSGVDNFNQIKHLKQSIKIKRQKFNHNYHSNEESQKITIEQFLEQFNKIEKELTQNEQEIENIISNIKKVKDSIVSEKNEKLGQLRDFKLPLLSENLRLLQQFRKFLIQKQSQLILLPQKAFNLNYDKNLDLLIYKDNQSQTKHKKQLDYYGKICRSLRLNEVIQDVLMKKQKIKEEILKEKQGCQIYHFRLKQFIQIGQHYYCICEFIQKIQELLKQIFKSLDNYQRTQEPSIKKISEEQILKPNNEAIQETNKRLLPIRIEQHSGVDNFNQIKHLKQSIKVKRQKFNHNYHSNEESQKITIEQLVEQFDKIEEELTQNEQEIENIISNIKKVKDSMVSEKNEKLVPPSTFNKDSENEHFE